MTDHIHGCLKCRSDIVPDFDPADERYHDGSKCGRISSVVVDGQALGHTLGSFGGPEGWTLFAGMKSDEVHLCPCSPAFGKGDYSICVEPRFGRVEVMHECPAIAAERKRRLDAHMARIAALRERP